MQTRIAPAATNKLGCGALLLLLLLLASLYFTIIRGERSSAGVGSVVDDDVGSRGPLGHKPSPQQQQQQQQLGGRRHHRHTPRTDDILSRRRRYLVFPQDSSMQLVFDETIPIVDYTLYVTTGQTLALAWELPHKPFALEDLFVPPQSSDVNNNDQVYGNRPPVIEPVAQPQPEQFVPSPPVKRRQDSYYFGGGGGGGGWQRYNRSEALRQQHRWPLHDAYNVNANWRQTGIDRYDGGWSHNSLDNEYVTRASTARTTTTTTTTTTLDPNAGRDIIISDNYPFIRKRPIIALPLGKRSADRGEVDYEETAHERHHRQTRYDLYRLIEMYLSANGHNGTACVMKTLCEVGQQHRGADNQPGTFVAEIVRAIFKLPANRGQGAKRPDDIAYHAAFDSCSSPCAEQFLDCTHSIWTASFFA